MSYAELQKVKDVAPSITPEIKGIVAEGLPLSSRDVQSINDSISRIPKNQYKVYVAYLAIIKIGGFIPWRFNNPGSFRRWNTEIANLNGFAIFATMEEGRRAQRARYLQMGDMAVKKVIPILTPESENDTAKYLKDLEKQGIKLDDDVKSQVDLLLDAVNKNEGGAGVGIEIKRQN